MDHPWLRKSASKYSTTASSKGVSHKGAGSYVLQPGYDFASAIDADGKLHLNSNSDKASDGQRHADWVASCYRGDKLEVAQLVAFVYVISSGYGYKGVDKNNKPVYVYQGGAPKEVQEFFQGVAKRLPPAGSKRCIDVGGKNVVIVASGQWSIPNKQGQFATIENAGAQRVAQLLDLIGVLMKDAVGDDGGLIKGLQPVLALFPGFRTILCQPGPTKAGVISFLQHVAHAGGRDAGIDDADKHRYQSLVGALTQEFPPGGLERKMDTGYGGIVVIPGADSDDRTVVRCAFRLMALLSCKNPAALGAQQLAKFDKDCKQLGGGDEE